MYFSRFSKLVFQANASMQLFFESVFEKRCSRQDRFYGRAQSEKKREEKLFNVIILMSYNWLKSCTNKSSEIERVKKIRKKKTISIAIKIVKKFESENKISN